MHIYLMGYRGSGKSTVAGRLAERLGMPMVDSDLVIEQVAGRSIRDIFAEEGESGFRQREEQALASIAARASPHIVALGGGAILRPNNQSLIQQTGRIVWLQGSPEFLLARIEADVSTAHRRPQLTQRTGYDEIAELLAQREPIYQRLAQMAVDTDHLTPDELAVKIADWINSFNQ